MTMLQNTTNISPFENDLNTSVLSDNIRLGMDDQMRVELRFIPAKLSLGAVGIVCNIFVFIGLKVPGQKFRPSDKLLLTLAFWDLVYLICHSSQCVTSKLYILGEAGSTYCRFVFASHLILVFMARMAFLSSLLCAIMVAVERCICCFFPLRMKTLYGNKRISLMIFISFLIPFCVSIPEAMFYFCLYTVYPVPLLKSTDPSFFICSRNSVTTVIITGILSRSCTKLLGWTILLIFDILLLHRLCVGARTARRMFVLHPKYAHNYNERSLTAAVVCMVVVYLLAYPVTGISWAMDFKNRGWKSLVDPRTKSESQNWLRLMQLFSCSINLFFLLLFGSRFRRNLFRKLCRSRFARNPWRH